MSRKPWSLPFQAVPGELAGLRRVIRLHLTLWGLPHVIDAAQLCVSELATNVIHHVGEGAHVELRGSIQGGRLRLELDDPGVGELPTQTQPGFDAESGRGLLLVEAVAADWGVTQHAQGKSTWVELETGLPDPSGHIGGERVTTAESLLTLYDQQRPKVAGAASRRGINGAEKIAIDLIADLLHWLHAHGCDTDGALKDAQTHFEAAVGR